MKTIGMIGGMSWESSFEYYRIVNEAVKERLGGHHSAQSLMYSVDFHDIKTLQYAGRWDDAAQALIDAAHRLERGGADIIILCTNTMHRVADEIMAAINVPFIHIADPTADAIKAAGISRIGLLGTAFTMEQEFYRGRLESVHGLEVLVPDEAERRTVHDIIYNELVLGEVKDESRQAYQQVIENLISRGAEGIILGCTEIMLLIKPEDVPVPSFDTTTLHAVAAVEWALEGQVVD